MFLDRVLFSVFLLGELGLRAELMKRVFNSLCLLIPNIKVEIKDQLNIRF